MVACPFQIPAYEYQNVLTPQVRKCQLCEHRTSKGELPACVQECPRQVMTYGPRDALLALAHEKIKAHPGRYVDHVYGEHEVGGTSWLYLSPVPHEAAGFLAVGTAAPPVLTEEIQHGVFKYWIAPLGWYAFLAGAFWVTGRRATLQPEAHHPPALLQAPAAECGPIVTLHHTRHRDAEGGDGVATALLDPPEETTRATARLASAAATGGPAEGPRQAHSRHADAPPARHGHEHPVLAQPAGGKLLTPGVWVLIALVAIGAIAAAYRFAFGLAASTNLDQQHPWGLWIAMDVGSGIALAGGGFVTAALVHIFHREHYHSIARSALLTALLGYTFYVPGLLADLGRWYNLWHPTIPTMWQGNSVLFEVGLCVMIYLNVQYAELMPIICEHFMGPGGKRPWVAKWAKFTHDNLERIMPALLILGVALSTFHQSSLGNLMVIAPYKLHALWWTPVSPILFLLSAMMVGFPMVIFTLLFGAWSLKRKPDMRVLAPLARYVPVFLVPYLGLKIGDMVVRGTYSYLAHPSVQSVAWIIEVVGGVVVPTVMLLMPRVRQSPRGLATACLLVIMGVVLNRLNVFIIGYHPPYATQTYFPSLVEMALSLGLVAALMLVYRVAVMYLPILDPAPAAEGQSQ
jgi:Ni/Fe-hydrogenase subunit HybB-like protein